jgi:hypothetical protein
VLVVHICDGSDGVCWGGRGGECAFRASPLGTRVHVRPLRALTARVDAPVALPRNKTGDPNSPWRDRPISESLQEFENMRMGLYARGSCAHPSSCHRPVHTPHPPPPLSHGLPCSFLCVAVAWVHVHGRCPTQALRRCV